MDPGAPRRSRCATGSEPDCAHSHRELKRGGVTLQLLYERPVVQVGPQRPAGPALRRPARRLTVPEPTPRFTTPEPSFHCSGMDVPDPEDPCSISSRIPIIAKSIYYLS